MFFYIKCSTLIQLSNILSDLSWFATYWYGIAKRNWYQSSKAWFLYVFAGPPLSQPWWWIPIVIDHMSHVSTAAGSCWPQNSWLEYVGIRNTCNQFCGSQLGNLILNSISLLMCLLAEDGAGNSGCSKLWANLAGRGRLDNLKITGVKRNTTFLQNPWT